MRQQGGEASVRSLNHMEDHSRSRLCWERTGHAHARPEAERVHTRRDATDRRGFDSGGSWLPDRTRAAAAEAPPFGKSSMGTPPRAEGVAGRGVHGWLSGKPVVADLQGSSSYVEGARMDARRGVASRPIQREERCALGEAGAGTTLGRKPHYALLNNSTSSPCPPRPL